VAQALVELDAVNDLDAAVQVNVVAANIAVPVADHASGHARLQQLPPLRQEVARAGRDRCVALRRDGPPDVGLDLLEVLLDVAGHRLGRAAPVDLRSARRLQVEAGDLPGDAVDCGVVDGVGQCQRPQRGFVWQAPHVYQVVDDLAVAAQPELPAGQHQRDDAQVDVGSQPPVQ